MAATVNHVRRGRRHRFRQARLRVRLPAGMFHPARAIWGQTLHFAFITVNLKFQIPDAKCKMQGLIPDYSSFAWVAQIGTSKQIFIQRNFVAGMIDHNLRPFIVATRFPHTLP